MNQMKLLILLRHSQRDPQDHSSDGGLSIEGWNQSRRTQKKLLEKLHSPPVRLISSPKRRCQESLQAFSEELGISIEIDQDLDEQGASEDSTSFRSRVQSFIEKFKGLKEDPVLICSHGDWIPEAIYECTHLITEIKQGGWAELSHENGKWILQDLIHLPQQ